MKDIIKIFADSTTPSGTEGKDSAYGTIKPVPGGDTDVDLTGSIITILNSVLGVIAVVCVVVIVMGGIQYMTSAGDAGKVKKAKDTILYAVIGLIVCALAATIVNFVVVRLLGSGE